MQVALSTSRHTVGKMRSLVVLVFAGLAVGVLSGPADDASRIVGGTETTINAYPYAAALLFSQAMTTFSQSCGGTVLNSRSILSAAHCFHGANPSQWRVRVGSTSANSGGTVHTAIAIFNHQSYNPSTLDNDVSIYRTATTIVFLANTVAPASIAGANYNLADNQVVWAIGWGRQWVNGPVSEQLRHVQIWTVNQTVCRNRYATLGWPITDNMLCSGYLDVGGRDQCQGDSGGPLLHNNVVVGVCSFGRDCALAFYPGVNARVSRFTAWIQANA